ncbi:hypothetical protein N7456_002442 [Penicillium angulare]|uniref:Uncharacterized protein n=1 Tax=Penicillium angulare TaxID=116970 RepID=A0A9W9KQB6_9EURO|nr:hypothetical protein N7456_002442 [Penicillium angulare]
MEPLPSQQQVNGDFPLRPLSSPDNTATSEGAQIENQVLSSYGPDILTPFDLTIPFQERKGRIVDSNAFLNIFPGTNGIWEEQQLITFLFEKPPPQPWPHRVAGKPCFLSDVKDPFSLGSPSNLLFDQIPLHLSSRKSGPSLLKQYDFQQDPSIADLVFECIKAFFEGAKVLIAEVQYHGEDIVIILEWEIDEYQPVSEFPFEVAGCSCYYSTEDDLEYKKVSRIPWQDYSFSRSPFKNSDAACDALRPGVRLSSSKDPETGEYTTSSAGVLVSDSSGNMFMTVAIHGFFSAPNNQVYHPGPEGRVIGEVVDKIGHTGIALVKLAPGETFVNEPFQNPELPLWSPPPSLTRFHPNPDTDSLYTPVIMETWASGPIHGTAMGQVIKRTTDDDGKNAEWIKYRWIYKGQGGFNTPITNYCSGVWGSPVFTKQGEVIGFFGMVFSSGRWPVPLVNSYYAVSSSYLTKAGFTLV